MRDSVFQRGYAAIVHVGSRDGDVAQRGRLELTYIVQILREFVEPEIGLRIGKAARHIVEARVVKFHLRDALTQIIDSPGKVESPVAVEALELSLKKSASPRFAATEMPFGLSPRR